MSAFRPISPEGFTAPKTRPDLGAAPMLQWVAVADLVVDDSYQRPIYGAGRSNVLKIAEGFRWSKFAPVIVAPTLGGKFAVIDGQHRATAAALLGIESVPAQVVIADAVDQAQAFKSINGQVTRMHRLALHAAAIAAGDEAALEIDAVAKAGGVTVLRYPRAVERMAPGETLALGALIEGLKAYGRETLITALTCVTETSNNTPGVLSSSIIKALCIVLGANARWQEAGGALLAAFDEIDLESEHEEARVTRRPKGVATHELLADRLAVALKAQLGDGA